MKRLLGLALVVSIFMLGGCVYGPGYYQRPAVVYDDGSVRNSGPVADGAVADGDYGYAYDDGYYAPGYYYGGGYGPWCCYGGFYPWIGVGFYGGYHGYGYHGWHGGGGHGGGWHGGGGGHWSGGGHSSGGHH